MSNRPVASSLSVLLQFALCACAFVSAAGCKQASDLSVEQLSRVVDAERATLKPCYDAALKDNPYQHEMRIEAVLHIAPSGQVSEVEIDKNGGLPGMPACLKQAIARWRFPSAKDETHASLPLVFKPELQPQGVPSLPKLNEILDLNGGK